MPLLLGHRSLPAIYVPQPHLDTVNRTVNKLTGVVAAASAADTRMTFRLRCANVSLFQLDVDGFQGGDPVLREDGLSPQHRSWIKRIVTSSKLRGLAKNFEPGDPFEGGELDVFEPVPRTAGVDGLGLVGRDPRLVNNGSFLPPAPLNLL